MTDGIRILPQADLDGGAQCRIEIDDTVLDEIVIKDKNGRCWFHLERMDEDNFWFAVYGKDETERHFALKWKDPGDSRTMEIIEQ